MGTPDVAWFEKVIAASAHGSIRQLAGKIRRRGGGTLDYAAVWRLIHGEREVLLHEARQLADLLDQPMAEVIRRLGVSFTPGDAHKKRER